MHQAQPSSPAVHPALADPEKRPVKGVYICRAMQCGRANVSYTDEPPAQCKNPKCSGEYKADVVAMPPGSTREWFRCRDTKDEEPRIEGGKLVMPPPSKVETIPAPPEDVSPVVIGEESETRVSDLGGALGLGMGEERISPAAYRSEWVADRVASMSDKAPFGTPVATADLWWWAEALYDEGKRRGHLP
jgi:hypothetical protein